MAYVTRVGIGYDVHRLVRGRPLVLGGLEIESTVGLEGHSDGDVLLHAVTDAILGACGLGDIGDFFPSSDPEWKNADSESFLQEALDRADDAGADVVNVDTVIVAERRRSPLWLLVTAAMGAVFLVGQGFEYARLLDSGIAPRTGLFGTTFFTLTGLHGLHVLVGLAALGTLFLVATLRPGATYSPSSTLTVSIASQSAEATRSAPSRTQSPLATLAMTGAGEVGISPVTVIVPRIPASACPSISQKSSKVPGRTGMK